MVLKYLQIKSSVPEAAAENNAPQAAVIKEVDFANQEVKSNSSVPEAAAEHNAPQVAVIKEVDFANQDNL